MCRIKRVLDIIRFRKSLTNPPDRALAAGTNYVLILERAKAKLTQRFHPPDMPSGNTHDAITFILALPVAGGAFYSTQSTAAAAVVTAAFVFGGLMFGPDLDTMSKQYSRWRFLRFFWIPYRTFFKHRSRWSHGLIFGALFRVIYFMGVLTLALLVASYCSARIFGTEMPSARRSCRCVAPCRGLSRLHAGGEIMILIFAGMWAGAASHTFADMAGSYIKTGRAGGFL